MITILGTQVTGEGASSTVLEEILSYICPNKLTQKSQLRAKTFDSQMGWCTTIYMHVIIQRFELFFCQSPMAFTLLWHLYYTPLS